MATESTPTLVTLRVSQDDQPSAIRREIERILGLGKIAENKELQDALITLHIWLQESLENVGPTEYLDLPLFVTLATDKPKRGPFSVMADWIAEKARRP